MLGGYRSSVSGESSGGGASAEPAFTVSAPGTYTVTIGSGGNGAVGNDVAGSQGSPSYFGPTPLVGGVPSTGGGGGEVIVLTQLLADLEVVPKQ